MLKRIILFLGILFFTLGAETPINTSSNIGKWQSYFGVEGGVGLMDVEIGAIASLNLGLADIYYLRGISYGGGILGGWQKYTSEKIGMRNTLGLRVFGAKDTKAGDDKYKDSEGKIITDTTFYYALDGLFDFVRNGNNRFGMSLGFSTDLFQLTLGTGAGGLGFVFHFASRIGFYTQFDNQIIELMVSVPLIGFVDFIAVGYNSTLTLGYKYLF